MLDGQVQVGEFQLEEDLLVLGLEVPSLVPLHSLKSLLVGCFVFGVLEGMFVLLNDLQNRVFLLEDIVFDTQILRQGRLLREKGYFQSLARDYLPCIGRIFPNKDF